jgi:hypothetical protein
MQEAPASEPGAVERLSMVAAADVPQTAVINLAWHCHAAAKT